MSESGLYKELLPIAHTTQQAQIEVTVNECGEFAGARVVSKDDAETVIPCTEQSAGRSGSHPVNHPLMDKLQYVAGDYTKYGGEKGDSFHAEFMKDLSEWCESEYSNPKIRALYQYLKKGTLISDLVQDKVLYCGSDNKLLKQYPDKDNVPQIFKVIPGAQSDAFVRFNVIGFDDRPSLWQDKKLRQDYINYYLSSREGNELCYILGKETSCSVNHPSKLRNSGDMAKLISANDTSGYTFRGRFLDANEAAGVSYEVSQGAHNALKWLIKNQGRNYGGRVYVTWNPKGYEIPDIDEDSYDALIGNSGKTPDTAEEFAEEFHNAMSGYKAKLEYYDQIIIMGVDAATTGRMAITFYREELANELINNLEFWHTTCAWKHRYRFSEEGKVQEFYGAPSPKDIALAAFGTERTNYLEMDDKLKKNTIERILCCIIDRSKLPYDIVNAVYANVCHPQNYKNTNTWRKVLSICCALLKKYYYERSEEDKKEEWTVEINEKEESLAYLCGRLLAVADALEKSTYSEEDRKNRTTNAIRYFTKFVEHPCQTWDIINKALQPYIAKLGWSAVYYQSLMGEISAKIPENDFLNAKNLDGRMALGFYAQQNYIYTKKENKTDN
jgi:CRISPR-associated protein Csd1